VTDDDLATACEAAAAAVAGLFGIDTKKMTGQVNLEMNVLPLQEQ
jgi:hypothetical protein